MELSITVRQAELSDINEIMKINKVCLPENYSFDFFYRILSDFGYACVIGELEEEIIGYVLSRIERPFTSFLGVQSAKGHVISIAIIPKYRRKGLGIKIMKYGLKKLIDHEVETIYLEVRVSNVAAIEMYRKLGFYIKKEFKEYYRDGESAFVMEWGKKRSSEMSLEPQ
jgi:ribosomal-protein-alanine N-acetyltransferase